MGSFDAGLLVWTVVTFGGLFFLLARFAFKPLTAILRQREEAIRRSLEDAEKARDEARGILEQNEKQLGQARQETARIINEGHRIVAEMSREAAVGAKQEAEAIVSGARVDIDRELQRSLDQLKETVAGLAVRISRQVLSEEMNTERHEQLADELMERLKKSYGRTGQRN